MGLSNIASFADARLCSSETLNDECCVLIGVDTWRASGELNAGCGGNSELNFAAWISISPLVEDFLFSCTCKNVRGGEYDDGVTGSEGEGRGEGFDHSEPVVGKSSLLTPSPDNSGFVPVNELFYF